MSQNLTIPAWDTKAAVDAKDLNAVFSFITLNKIGLRIDSWGPSMLMTYSFVSLTASSYLVIESVYNSQTDTFLGFKLKITSVICFS